MADEDAGSRALVKAGGKLDLARSLDSADVGQAIFIDKRGDVRRPLLTRLPLAAAVGLGAAAGAAVGLASSLVGPAVVGALFLGCVWFVWQLRNTGGYRDAVRLAAAGKRDEAYEAFLALRERSLAAPFRDSVDSRLGMLAAQRGAIDEAIARLDGVLPRLAARRPGAEYWLAACFRAELAAVTGDVDRARRMQQEVSAGPPGELFVLLRQSLALVIAFHTDAPETLPDDATLHEWARAALRRNRFGGMLVTLSWAFLRRGDEGMARHLLAEAPARLADSYLGEIYPKIQAWMVERASEWGDGEGGAGPGSS